MLPERAMRAMIACSTTAGSPEMAQDRVRLALAQLGTVARVAPLILLAALKGMVAAIASGDECNATCPG